MNWQVKPSMHSSLSNRKQFDLIKGKKKKKLKYIYTANSNTILTTKLLLTKSSFSKSAKSSVHLLLPRRSSSLVIYPRPDLERSCDVSCVRLLLEREINWEIWVLWRNLVWLIRLKRKLRRVLDCYMAGGNWRIGELEKWLGIVSLISFFFLNEWSLAGVFNNSCLLQGFRCKNETCILKFYWNYILLCVLYSDRVKIMMNKKLRATSNSTLPSQIYSFAFHIILPFRVFPYNTVSTSNELKGIHFPRTNYSNSERTFPAIANPVSSIIKYIRSIYRVHRSYVGENLFLVKSRSMPHPRKRIAISLN